MVITWPGEGRRQQEEPRQQPSMLLGVNARRVELALLVPGPRKRSLDLKLQHPEPQSNDSVAVGWGGDSESPTEVVDG